MQTKLLIAIWKSIFLAIIFSFFPFPGKLALLKPDLVLLLIIFWSSALPGLFGLKSSIGIGLLLDVSKGLLLGQQTIIYSTANYLGSFLNKKLKIYSVMEQMVLILPIVFISKTIFLLIEWQKIETINLYFYTYSSVLTIFCWPLICFYLGNIKIQEYR